jgi:hypothetical protein
VKIWIVVSGYSDGYGQSGDTNEGVYLDESEADEHADRLMAVGDWDSNHSESLTNPVNLWVWRRGEDYVSIEEWEIA